MGSTLGKTAGVNKGQLALDWLLLRLGLKTRLFPRASVDDLVQHLRKTQV